MRKRQRGAWAEVCDLLAILDYGTIQAWAATKGYDWAHGLVVAAAFKDIPGSCYHRRWRVVELALSV